MASVPQTQQGCHPPALLQQILFVWVGFYCSYGDSLWKSTFKCKMVYHPQTKLVRRYTIFMFLPFQCIIHQYHAILTVLETSTSETHSPPLDPLLSFPLCNYIADMQTTENGVSAWHPNKGGWSLRTNWLARCGSHCSLVLKEQEKTKKV